MRVLLDECLPRTLKDAFPGGHEVTTVPERDWSGKTNGELLHLASGEVDVFVTIDSGIEHQHNLTALPFTTVLLHARSNRLSELLPLVPVLLEQLATTTPGQIIRLPASEAS